MKFVKTENLVKIMKFVNIMKFVKLGHFVCNQFIRKWPILIYPHPLFNDFVLNLRLVGIGLKSHALAVIEGKGC